jgi:hypothetical protein
MYIERISRLTAPKGARLSLNSLPAARKKMPWLHVRLQHVDAPLSRSTSEQLYFSAKKEPGRAIEIDTLVQQTKDLCFSRVGYRVDVHRSTISRII